MIYIQYLDYSVFLGARGIIDWFLDYHEIPKLPKDEEFPLKPFPNPIMLGCAFVSLI